MNRKITIIGIVLAVALGSGFYYRFTHLATGKSGEKASQEVKEGKEPKGDKKESEKDEQPKSVTMSVEKQKQHGVVVAAAGKERLGGVISATGKVEVNSDRIAHISPRIPGKIASVKASLGDSVAAGQVLVMLDSLELSEALNRYKQSNTKLLLAKNNMDRVKALVEKKIAARKEILLAESDYQTAMAEQHSNEERLLLYGLSPSDLNRQNSKRQLLPVRSVIAGVITEKHAIAGELADPAKSLYTVADLSTVWVLTDINEKELAKIRKGQSAVVSVAAFAERKFRGRINYISDVVDDATRTVKARIEVQNPGRLLKPEMFANVELSLPADSPAVLAVPVSSIQDLEGKKVLFVTENGTEFKPRSVDLGRASGGKVEITGGLKDGERFAVKGGFLLKSELKKGELGEE